MACEDLMLLPRTWMIRFNAKTIYKAHDMVRLTVIVAITFLSNLAFLHNDHVAAHQWDVPVPYLPESTCLFAGDFPGWTDVRVSR